MAIGLLSSDSNIIRNTAGLLSLTAITVGTNIFFLNGTIVPRIFCIKPPTNKDDRKTYDALCGYVAVREYLLAGANIIAWYSGQPKAQGVILLLWAGMGIGDGIVLNKLHGINVLKARPLAFVLAGLASVLMGWLE
ncbi:uncharacterized protein N7483_013216 [Penicillium malachiteum]|uniref:uncharacterized protein n=1 Tax=Penicillium malachiteum TaxID=1324776 RepID=UPI002549B567|nr:uncharacterized protein N7483_013216 [Penicillium malachiteum]KAJ5716035.1 hypothetical protein N7483_013216 [Penicillium malachiteum]